MIEAQVSKQIGRRSLQRLQWLRLRLCQRLLFRLLASSQEAGCYRIDGSSAIVGFTGFTGFTVFKFLSCFFQKGFVLLKMIGPFLTHWLHLEVLHLLLGLLLRECCYKIREFFVYFIKIQAGGPLITDIGQDGLEGIPPKGKTYVYKVEG